MEDTVKKADPADAVDSSNNKDDSKSIKETHISDVPNEGLNRNLAQRHLVCPHFY